MFSRAHIQTILIDLDDTVYPPSTGIWTMVKRRIHAYMVNEVGIPEADAHALRERYLATYGTTLRGLQTELGVDMHAYLHYVHDFDLDPILQPDLALDSALGALPQTKWIFTNASRAHALNVLSHLALERHFMGIIDVVTTYPYCKPQAEAFAIALNLAGVSNPSRCLFVDDRALNIDTARSLGLQTVLIAPEPTDNYITIPQLDCLPGLFTA